MLVVDGIASVVNCSMNSVVVLSATYVVELCVVVSVGVVVDGCSVIVVAETVDADVVSPGFFVADSVVCVVAATVVALNFDVPVGRKVVTAIAGAPVEIDGNLTIDACDVVVTLCAFVVPTVEISTKLSLILCVVDGIMDAGKVFLISSRSFEVVVSNKSISTSVNRVTLSVVVCTSLRSVETIGR